MICISGLNKDICTSQTTQLYTELNLKIYLYLTTIATEAHDDDGLPHTLEHLVFLGSELYPYKGVLDLLANRCLASGTNAWTDTDHTCYTVKTVGKDGFLNLLPIYLDHVLYPTLSVSKFYRLNCPTVLSAKKQQQENRFKKKLNMSTRSRSLVVIPLVKNELVD